MLRFLSYLVLFIVGSKIIKSLFSRDNNESDSNNGNRDVEIKNNINEKPITDGKGEYIDYEEIKD